MERIVNLQRQRQVLVAQFLLYAHIHHEIAIVVILVAQIAFRVPFGIGIDAPIAWQRDGIFEVNDATRAVQTGLAIGQIHIEPYEYYDRDVLVTVSEENLIKDFFSRARG